MDIKLEKKIREISPFIRAVTDLFKPFAEVSVHDTAGKIVYIDTVFSKRKLGDRQVFKNIASQDYFPPHFKMSHDGILLKCAAIPLKDYEGALIGILSFAVDAGHMKGLFGALSQFLGSAKEIETPQESGFEEKAKNLVDEFFKERGDSSRHLNRKDKKELIQYLHKKGLFNYKKAPFELSKWLKISRASIYNYIKNQ